jgi:ferritin-like metal-binding protein YciE
MPPMVSLRDLYMAELQELADAEQQMLAALPSMIAAATSSRLRDALQDHLDQTRIHRERLELLLRRLGAAGESPSEAMRALIVEGRRRMADAERGDVLDAALIGVAQRIEHYEIAAYGCARTYARTLEDGEAEQLLQQTLDEEGAADARLSRIAERGINEEAAEDATLETARLRERLRYVPASAISGFKYREFRVRNAQDEDLGSLDGLIVDESGQPAYFVIDSGGWFVGQRFLVPINALRPQEDTRTLRTELDREAIQSYPPFTPDAFARENAAGETVASEPYQPPTWLMTGVWMTEASGFASVPPRAQSDYQPAPDAYPENELMRARGEDDRERDPRIERYRER